MKCLNLRDFWDKQDPLAQELYSIASLMYSGNFQILFNKFIFAWQINDKNRVGKLYNSNGDEVVSDDIVSASPLIISKTNKIVGYLILSKDTKERIDTNLSKRKYKRWLYESMPRNLIYDLLDSNEAEEVDLASKSILNTILGSSNTYKCMIINNEGKIENAIINLESTNRLDGGTVKYHGNNYIIVTDNDGFINNCVCTA